MKDFLPEEFHFSHDFALYLHDLLAQMIVYGESNKVFDVNFKLLSKEHASQFAGLQGEQILIWLEKNQYSDVIGEILLKEIFPALLSDFCHFTFEALSCSRKAKLTVTYALLRKPLREDLFYLEWLLADPEDLLNTLYNCPPSELDINRRKSVEVVRKAISRLPNSEIYDPELLYDLRFNKAADFGFAQLWDKALHLVTTSSHLETERQNFNFIFSNDESRWSLWRYLYSRLPILLFYTVDICYVLMALILDDLYPKHAELAFQRSLGYILWVNEIRHWNSECDRIDIPFSEPVELTLDCPRCNRQIPPGEVQIRSLFEKGKTRCPHCRRTISIADFAAMYSE
jgi:hypothetical protein